MLSEELLQVAKLQAGHKQEGVGCTKEVRRQSTDFTSSICAGRRWASAMPKRSAR